LSRTFRALAAALAVAVASLGGALFLAHERTARSADGLTSGTGVAAIDLASLLSSGAGGDQGMLDNAFRQVERTYYKPVNAQTLMTGEQHELVAYLKGHHIEDPDIPALYATGDEDKDIGALNRDLERAQTLYGQKTSNAELTQAAIRGMLNALGDPYTTYLAPSENKALEESLEGGNFGGIGVYIQQMKTGEVIVAPIEGTPAYRAGVHLGDRIVAVDGHPVAQLKLDQVSQMIRGPVGTTVVLRLIRPPVSPAAVHIHGASQHATPLEVSILREQIQVPTVRHAMLDGFEYVRLADFGKTSYQEVRKALLDGKAHNAKGYIFDLRNNGGGLLDAAVDISSLFIPDGTIVSTVERDGVADTRTAEHTSVGAMPLVVLVNKYTASASEITAGAIQDYGVGTLLGTKTFGKGVVQSIFRTPDGGALKITTARYLTPHGRDIQHRGVEPDIVVDQPAELPILETKYDKQLIAAENYLRHKSAR